MACIGELSTIIPRRCIKKINLRRTEMIREVKASPISSASAVLKGYYLSTVDGNYPSDLVGQVSEYTKIVIDV